jgi:hypothetical protein
VGKYRSIEEIVHSRSFLEIAEGIQFREELNYIESEYHGMKFEIIRELRKSEFDRQDTDHRKYEIKLENGERMFVHDHEIETGLRLKH